MLIKTIIVGAAIMLLLFLGINAHAKENAHERRVMDDAGLRDPVRLSSQVQEEAKELRITA